MAEAFDQCAGAALFAIGGFRGDGAVGAINVLYDCVLTTLATSDE